MLGANTVRQQPKEFPPLILKEKNVLVLRSAPLLTLELDYISTKKLPFDFK